MYFFAECFNLSLKMFQHFILVNTASIQFLWEQLFQIKIWQLCYCPVGFEYKVHLRKTSDILSNYRSNSDRHRNGIFSSTNGMDSFYQFEYFMRQTLLPDKVCFYCLIDTFHGTKPSPSPLKAAGVVYSTIDHLNVQMHKELKYNIVQNCCCIALPSS